MTANTDFILTITHPITGGKLAVATGFGDREWDLYDDGGYAISLPSDVSMPVTLRNTDRLTIAAWNDRGVQVVAIEDHQAKFVQWGEAATREVALKVAFEHWRTELHRRYWKVEAERLTLELIGRDMTVAALQASIRGYEAEIEQLHAELADVEITKNALRQERDGLKRELDSYVEALS